LTERCTIRIFAVDDTLVRTLVHGSNMQDGSGTQDILSKDNIDVAFGIYIYHVDNPGIEQHIGRLFII
jgi:hypothetical protein